MPLIGFQSSRDQCRNPRKHEKLKFIHADNRKFLIRLWWNRFDWGYYDFLVRQPVIENAYTYVRQIQSAIRSTIITLMPLSIYFSVLQRM